MKHPGITASPRFNADFSFALIFWLISAMLHGTMTSRNFLMQLKNEHEAFDVARREIIALSAKAQSASKRAIFSIQREDEAGAKALLAGAEDLFESIHAKASVNARLAHEGSYRAALEEYAEARFVAQLAWRGEVSALEGLDEETQIAGLCDAV